MDNPVEIHQTWRQKYGGGYYNVTLYPIVYARLNKFAKMTPIKRSVWIEFIKKGWMSVSDDLRKWLDENGYSDIKNEV